MAKQKTQARRHLFQALWAAATNSYFTGFVTGKIYSGNLKVVCVPGLNCYSCPGAVGSCPIGALQAVLSDRRFMFSCYIFGFLTLVGALCGRFVCGWLCPFGLIQDLLHKIPFPKKIRTFRGDRVLRYAKYVVLVVLVILLPLFAVDVSGRGDPWFCKWLCPAGTLEGGIPLVLLNAPLRAGLGFLYAWKMAILAAVLIASVIIYRPFCRYLCPLGAIYALFNPVSLLRVKPGPICARCPMCATPNGRECIRCAGGPSLERFRRITTKEAGQEAPETAK
ncbi:4Fe-4S binding protein [Eubacteriales bacterium OttesenSCG-928-A19]|nr:4Fe-4S binding protein [Eubacteriales bacterium OttesenSCG-928-A19]